MARSATAALLGLFYLNTSPSTVRPFQLVCVALGLESLAGPFLSEIEVRFSRRIKLRKADMLTAPPYPRRRYRSARSSSDFTNH